MGRPSPAAGRFVAGILAGLVAAAPVAAQPAGDAAPGEDLQALVSRIQDRLRKMNEAADATGNKLEFLERQVDRAIDRLGSRQDENEALRDHSETLRGSLDELSAESERLGRELAEAEAARQQEIAALSGQVTGLRDELAASRQKVAALEAETARLNELLEREREAAAAAREEALVERSKVVGELEAEVARLSNMLLVEREERAALTGELTALRDKETSTTAELSASLAELRRLREQIDESERAATAAGRENRLLAASLEEEQLKSDMAARRIELLNWQINELRQQLATLNNVLEASEERSKDQQTVIFELERRLNQALAAKALELARYRSEFFGRLREALGDREDIGIVGDRFVFQAEVLFSSGEATLEPAGRQRLAEFSGTLKEVAAQIPADVAWLLRVDGHTDRRPIRSERFPTNWELSTARATEVVRFLIAQGIPPERLMAAGLGEHHPIAVGDSPADLRRNRRIEFRLTQP